MRVLQFLRALVVPPEKPKPLDQKAFEEARKRLHKKSKEFAREVDTFGDYVAGQRGERKKRTRSR